VSAARHEKMVNAAAWLAEQEIARIGWAAIGEGKAAGSVTGNKWQDTAVDDPAAVRKMLTTARNALVIPRDRGIIIDIDAAPAWAGLAEAGLPPTFTIDSPTPGHGHVYGLVPDDIDMSTIPGTFEHGEIRRFDPRTGTSSMVLGPWAQLPDGREYRPRDGVRSIATLPRSVIDYLIASSERKRRAQSRATSPADPGWFIEKGKHDFLVAKARNLRGIGLTGERLLNELKRLDAERNRPPLASIPDRGVAEIERIAGWTNGKIADDPPGVTINMGERSETASNVAVPVPFPEPEDFGLAQPSELVDVEYVDDFIRPGRLHLIAAEEGSGKSFAIDSELGVRVALAGGSFAETWPVLRNGPVVVLSEMHADDDLRRLDTVCAALGRDRIELSGRYYRLPLYQAANGQPCLAVPEWRRYIIDWCRDHGVLMLIFDTATGAVNVDPWGREIQQLFRDLRAMLGAYPGLAIVLIVHLKKPNAHGARRLSDVLGEWGRWNDITMLMEADGLERVRIELRKRVRRERRIVVTKCDGLLVDPREVESAGPKVAQSDFLKIVGANPGLTADELAPLLNVKPRTVRDYARKAGDALRTEAEAVRGSVKRLRYFTRHAADGAVERPAASPAASQASTPGFTRRRGGHPIRGAASPAASVEDADPVVDGAGPVDLIAEAERIFGDDLAPVVPWNTEAMVARPRADA